ncbi:MAG: serine protease [Bacteroidales bacterium]|nr:serine protease [Bacteroidales bacterium]
MLEFFNTMDPYLKILWFISIPVSFIFIIQTVLTFVGMDSSDGASADFDGDMDGGDMPFQLFSLRNLINFFLGFSWGGIAFYGHIQNKILLTGIALLIGIGMLMLFFFIIRQIMKLSQDGTMNIQTAVGETASVYLTIPGNNKGKGKINIKIQETLREIDAMTDGETLPTGTMVKVVEVINGTMFKVEKI